MLTPLFFVCVCHTSLNTFFHGALSAARMFSLMLRCMINYLISVKLGSHHLWSGSNPNIPLAALGDGEKECRGKKKRNGMWIGKQLQCSRRQGCFVVQRAYSLLNVTSFQTVNSHHPLSAQLWHTVLPGRGGQTVKLIPSLVSSPIATSDKWLRDRHSKVSWKHRVHSWESCVMATPVLLSWRKY